MTDGPLSKHAFAALQYLTLAPIPSMQINPGVLRKFHKEGITVTVQAPSPYKKHKGDNINHEQITDLGRELLRTTRGAG